MIPEEKSHKSMMINKFTKCDDDTMIREEISIQEKGSSETIKSRQWGVHCQILSVRLVGNQVSTISFVILHQFYIFFENPFQFYIVSLSAWLVTYFHDFMSILRKDSISFYTRLYFIIIKNVNFVYCFTFSYKIATISQNPS